MVHDCLSHHWVLLREKGSDGCVLGAPVPRVEWVCAIHLEEQQLWNGLVTVFSSPQVLDYRLTWLDKCGSCTLPNKILVQQHEADFSLMCPPKPGSITGLKSDKLQPNCFMAIGLMRMTLKCTDNASMLRQFPDILMHKPCSLLGDCQSAMKEILEGCMAQRRHLD